MNGRAAKQSRAWSDARLVEMARKGVFTDEPSRLERLWRRLRVWFGLPPISRKKRIRLARDDRRRLLCHLSRRERHGGGA